MQTYIDVDPQALFLMRMSTDTRSAPSNWFNAAYPDEVEVLSDGSRNFASFASTVWREEVTKLLAAFIQHLRDTGMYDRVIAYQIGAGSSGEWIKDMSCMLLPSNDFSAPMQRHFRAWLKARYHDDAGLAAAWADPAATLAAAVVPSHEMQSNTTGHTFRDPRREQAVIDYYECLAEVCGRRPDRLLRDGARADGRRKADRRLLWLHHGIGLEHVLLRRQQQH